MDPGLLRGVFTVLMLVLFIGICIWAWSSRQKPTFDAAAQLPLESDDKPPPEPADRS
ncbi:MAG: cytochrome c oxidase cbb3-type subunit [Pseudomonadota bacterium]|jgi:cytochrome c oxidase cbb3-type subunit 4|nr:cytochrome c oxidase cbb3-type subunit [Pseudomonadota bacterium]